MHYCKQTVALIDRWAVPCILIFFAVFLYAPPLMAETLGHAGQKNDTPEYTRAFVSYDVPTIAVVRQDGKKMFFNKELDDGRPVILNFVFVSCSAICPMLSHIFSRVQAKLNKDGQKAHLVSVSIDPENDTPETLTEYAKKFGAGPDWNFYTSTRETSIAVQKAFNAYRGDKMNHASVIFMRAAPGKQWLRLEGFISPEAVVQEYFNMIQQ
jgi:protein SCO1/2